jgi:hypothetical protein
MLIQKIKRKRGDSDGSWHMRGRGWSEEILSTGMASFMLESVITVVDDNEGAVGEFGHSAQ